MQRANPSPGQSRERSPPRKRHRPASSLSTTLTPPSASLATDSLATAATAATSTPLAPSPPSAKWFRKPSVVWYRGNDLRVEDHPALLAAAQRGGPVIPFFVWDPLDGFGANLGSVKQWWLRESLTQLKRDLLRLGVHLYTRTGRSTHELRKFLDETGADAVFWNRCYEPDLLTRDEELRKELSHEGLTAESFKAELLVEPWELTNSEISPSFPTFHSYMCVWMTVPPPPQPLPCPSHLLPITTTVKSTEINNLGFQVASNIDEALTKIWSPGSTQAKIQLDKFLHEVFPAFGEEKSRRHFEGTSRLSPHIRFGELSPRRMYHSTRLRVSRWDQSSALETAFSAAVSRKQATSSKLSSDNSAEQNKQSIPTSSLSAARKSKKNKQSTSSSVNTGVPPNAESIGSAPEEPKIINGTSHKSWNGAREYAMYRKRTLPHISLSARAFLKNLCLRDFSYHVLYHNPDFNTKPLVPEFANFPWAPDNGGFESWRSATTGYPIVDAAMRELKETGWIHNSMRIVLACFLTKYLLLPWARGLKEFYELLLDGDHSSNALGWQWTAGSNTDAFPFSCLVNPVKVAHRHDQTGGYVRRWLPELAKIPNEYIHQPWKASCDVLLAAGVELGKTYPNRIVLVSEARNRAREAMAVMKQILSGSTVLRSMFDGKDDVLIKEWPEEDVEVPPMEETMPFNSKLSLLPSLWSLLQCDQQASACLTGSVAGTDHLIAMETASLAEGALAMPIDDQHESIEHALITAHEQGSSGATISVAVPCVPIGSDNDREKPEQILDQHNETDPCVAVEGGNGMEVEQIEERMKYLDPDVSSYEEREKPVKPIPASTPPDAREQSDPSGIPHRSTPGFHSVPLSTHSAGLGAIASHSLNSSVALQYPPGSQQHIQQIQQLQQQQFHQMQQFQLQQQKQQHPQVHNVMDGMYITANPSGNLPNNNVAGVPMSNPPVMMGPATGPADLSPNPMMQSADPSSAMYAHQMNIPPFYGFPPVMPMVNPLGLNADRNDVTGTAGVANAQKLAMPGMLPMYGVYGGSGMFDASGFGNSFASGGAQYGTLPASQQQSHGGPQNPYGLPGPPMYFSAPMTNDVLHRQSAVAPSQRNAVHTSGQNQPVPSNLQGQANNVTAAMAAAAVVAGGMEIANNVVSETQTAAGQHVQGTVGVHPSVQHTIAAPSSSIDTNKVAKGNSTVNPTSRPSQSRGVTKSGSRAASSRSRRGSSSSGLNAKTKSEGGGQSNSRNRNSDSGTGSSAQRGTRVVSSPAGTTLKDRRKILSNVLEKEDHKYHGFARYLTAAYELTVNTDRHTSKDYVRLCNLKDDYHKQCKSDEDKLKIYTIKNFFSAVLKLEVTGEWDRHNHGGVRGPYVYGIRVRKSQDGKVTSV